MSQDESPPPDESALGEDEMLREMYEQMQSLTERVTDLEDENEQLRNENEQLQDTVSTLKKKVTTLEEQTTDLDERTTSVETQTDELTDLVNATSARADVIVDELENVQEDLTDQSYHAEQKRSEIAKRVTGIENELGLEDWETTSAINSNACALERFASMPDSRRDDELKAPVSRATLVWENFDEWSSPTHKGRVIRSGELRKLLEAKTDKKLAWTQVYRVMEEFADNTTLQYKYYDGEKEGFGKALIRLRDFQDGERAATDGGHR